MKQKMHHGSIKPKYVLLGRLSNVGSMIKELKKDTNYTMNKKVN